MKMNGKTGFRFFISSIVRPSSIREVVFKVEEINKRSFILGIPKTQGLVGS